MSEEENDVCDDTNDDQILEDYDYQEDNGTDEESVGKNEDCSSLGQFKLPDGGFKMIEYKDVDEMLDSLIVEVSSLLDLSYDAVMVLLLSKFRWDKEKLIDGYYADPHKVISDAGVDIRQDVTKDR